MVKAQPWDPKKGKPMTKKEFEVLRADFAQQGLPQAIFDLMTFVGGFIPRSEGALNQLMNSLKRLEDVEPGVEGTKRDINSVQPHPTPLQDPTVRGSVRAKPNALDATRKETKPKFKP